MIPEKIRMIDFLSYEDESFDFSKISSATVVGRNGAGKSSFCTDAVTWALFGQGSKGGATERANYVRRGAGACTVELSFLMNGHKYKVVRSYTVQSKKTSLVVFGVTDAGDEIPMSTKATEAQAQICDMLKMDYNTFTASSIVLQNQIHAFTEGMGDTQKKEALLSVLNVGVWDVYRRKNTENTKRLKSEMDVLAGKLSLAEEAARAKEEWSKAAQSAEAALKEATKKKSRRKTEVDAFADKIAAMKSAEESVASTESLLMAKEKMANDADAEKRRALSRIAEADKKIEEIANSVKRIERIVSHGEEIRSAAKREAKISEALAAMQAAMAEHAASQQQIARLADIGKKWNADHDAKMQMMKERLAEKEKQASLVASVPCANTNVAPKCPLLSMAFAAKRDAEKIVSELNAIAVETNPYRSEYVMEMKKNKELASKFSAAEIEAREKELAETHKYAVLLPALESAAEQEASFRSLLEAENAAKSEAANVANVAEQKKAEIQKETAELANVLAKKKEEMKSFASIKAEYEKTLASLADAEREENDAMVSLTKAKTEMERADASAGQAKEMRAKMDALGKKQEALALFGDACNRINGVPAFIVANAIPELENSANEILGKMMDGRLQIKFRTSKSDSDDVVGNLFRIDVSDQAEVDPRDFSTFSGAEKFIIALSIRIAMSRFLAHRAGASVQLFVLDEGVSCADAENREEIVRALRSLSDDFAKVLFITHDEELKDVLESKITVTKTSTGSHLSLG